RCGTLMATRLSIQVSCARYTVPKPPLPSGATILYLPRFWPLKSNGGGRVLKERVQKGGQGDCASIARLDDNPEACCRGSTPRTSIASGRSLRCRPTRRAT